MSTTEERASTASARVIALRGADALEALSVSDAVAETAEAEGSVAVVVSDLAGQAILLGAHQRRATSLRAPGEAAQPDDPSVLRAGRAHPLADAPVLRRATGGVAIVAGEGSVYAALVLPHPGAIVPSGSDRLLNRYLRGVVKTLTRLGAPAQYLGRDFVSVLHRPAVWVGWDRLASGQCRVELLVSVTRTFPLPEALDGRRARAKPAFGGNVPITLVEAAAAAGGSLHDPAEACERLVERLPAALLSVPTSLGGSGAPLLRLVPRDPTGAERTRAERRAASIAAADPLDDAELCWSRAIEDAIGFVEAGVRLRADGQIARARIAGDFYAERAGLAALEGALVGLPPTPEAIGTAIDGALGPGGHVLEGLASLRPIQAALLDAVDRARGEPSG